MGSRVVAFSGFTLELESLKDHSRLFTKGAGCEINVTGTLQAFRLFQFAYGVEAPANNLFTVCFRHCKWDGPVSQKVGELEVLPLVGSIWAPPQPHDHFSFAKKKKIRLAINCTFEDAALGARWAPG